MKSKTYAQKKLCEIDIKETLEKQANLIISSLRKELQKIKEINSVVLFGSFARGDYSLKSSDIDIMVFLDREQKDAKIEAKVLNEVIKINLDKEITIHTLFQYKKIEDEDKSLMLTISTEGKVLFARKSIVISQNLLGLKDYYLIHFDTTNTSQVTKNKLQRFLYGYKVKDKKYNGIIDGETVFCAGRSAVLIPQNMLRKIQLFSKNIGVNAIQKGKFYR